MLKWGTPALSSTGQSQTYDPGSTYWVTLDVSPGTAAPGPPNRVNHVGRGADVRIASAYAFKTSAAVRPASSRRQVYPALGMCGLRLIPQARSTQPWLSPAATLRSQSCTLSAQ